ncbi:MAG: YhgE/Pip domain-containing protein [Candidatus Saccharibacteria bacterium]|nr:YhgE/Pip domain-containing protein [Candidatus Saccharibacteria bacterium]
MIRAELKKIWQNKMLLVTVIAICCVPILYAGFFLKGVWNPYGNLDSLKVAVVNEDQATVFNGQTLAVGDQVVESLRQDDTFDWQFVDAEQAKESMDNNDYYMVVTLPNDMSAKAATITNANPEQMNIQYETNGALNYPIETVASTAADKIKSQVSAQVTTAYANSLIATIKSTGGSLQVAADGADNLTTGAQQLNTGINQLQNSSKTLVSSVNQLNNGAQTLASGVNQLASQLQTSPLAKNPQLAAQLQQLVAGTNQLATGLQQLDNSAPQLTAGIDKLSSGSKQLVNGSNELQAKLQSGADTINNTPLSERTAQQIASPVATTQTKHSQVENYGHGLAPYFMSVALFVGCMMFTLAYPVRKKADRKGTWFGWFTSKAFISIISATIMAIIEASVMLALGLKANDTTALYVNLILYSNAIMALCMFLAITFDNPGRFVAMLVLILSLSASGGTFPIETSASFYQAMHPFVPITYSLSALRNAISGGIAANSISSAQLYFITMFVICTALMALSMYILNRWKDNNADRSRTDGNEDLLTDDYSNYKLKRS